MVMCNYLSVCSGNMMQLFHDSLRSVATVLYVVVGDGRGGLLDLNVERTEAITDAYAHDIGIVVVVGAAVSALTVMVRCRLRDCRRLSERTADGERHGEPVLLQERTLEIDSVPQIVAEGEFR